MPVTGFRGCPWRHSSSLNLLDRASTVWRRCGCSALGLEFPACVTWRVASLNRWCVHPQLSVCSDTHGDWFHLFEGRDGELVVNTQSKRVSSYLFQKPKPGRKCMDLTLEWTMQVITDVMGMTAIYSAPRGIIRYRKFFLCTSKVGFTSNRIERTVVDITQLGCPQLPELNLPVISCNFACHRKFNIFVSSDLLMR
jgi:hypothetical protein